MDAGDGLFNPLVWLMDCRKEHPEKKTSQFRRKKMRPCEVLLSTPLHSSHDKKGGLKAESEQV